MICPDREPALNALIDGELDPAASRALAAHLASCPGCAAGLVEMLALRGEMAALAPPASPALAARVGAALAAEAAGVASPRPGATVAARAGRPAARRRGWKGYGRSLGGLAAGLAVAGLVLLVTGRLVRPGPSRGELVALSDAAGRLSLPLPQAPTSQGSAPARRAAGPWFRAAGLPAVPAPELVAAGFRFAGFRADLVAGHRAAVVVYRRRGGAAVALFAWRAGAGEGAHPPRRARVGERLVVYWNDGTTEFWAVGARGDGVRDFVAAYRRVA